MFVRVQRIGGVYYPQYKRLFWWNYFYSLRAYDYMEKAVFNTLEEAKEYVCQVQEEYYYPNCKRKD